MRSQTAKPGFTMIELLVVVMLIAILVTIIIGVSGAVIARGKAETTRKNMQLVLAAIDAFAETDTVNHLPPTEQTAFPTINGATGNRGIPTTPPEFAAANPNDSTLDGNRNWMAVLRAKYLSQQLLGWTETVAPFTIHAGNAPAKVKLGNAPTAMFTLSYQETDGATTLNPSQPLFVDAYGKYMDYSSSRGAGATPVLISAGPDGMFGTQDDIRSDRR